jgi:hypothetical protein
VADINIGHSICMVFHKQTTYPGCYCYDPDGRVYELFSENRPTERRYTMNIVMIVLDWIKNNPATITAGILIIVRLLESYLLTKKLDLSILKEFFTLR